MSDQQKPQHAAKEKKESSDATANRRVTRTKSYWLGENPAGDFDAWLRERIEAHPRDGERASVTAPIAHDAAARSSTPLPRFSARPLDTAPMERSTNGARTAARNEHAEQARSSTIRWVQPKLRINAPGDRYEQEADRAADEVVKRIASGPERASGNNGVSTPTAKPASGAQAAPVKIQAKTNSPAAPASGGQVAPPSVDRALNAPGQALPQQTREQMEEQFGEDFDDVRVHTSAAAADAADDINARAFTAGRSIVFGDGEFRPGTAGGDRLLAHELAHVVQQGGRAMAVQRVDNEIIGDTKDYGYGLEKDIIGHWPERQFPKEGVVRFRIDADGDGSKEMLVTFLQTSDGHKARYEKKVDGQVTIRMISTGEHDAAGFTISSSQFTPDVTQLSDGVTPTKFQFHDPDDTSGNPYRQTMWLFPPKNKRGKLVYKLAHNFNGEEIRSVELELSRPKKSKRDTIRSTTQPEVVGGVSFLDVDLGAYSDRFRITASSVGNSGTQVLLGITAMNRTLDNGPKLITPKEGDTPGGTASFILNFGTKVVESDKAGFDPTMTLQTAPVIKNVSKNKQMLELDLDGDDVADIVILDRIQQVRNESGAGHLNNWRDHVIHLIWAKTWDREQQSTEIAGEEVRFRVSMVDRYRLPISDQILSRQKDRPEFERFDESMKKISQRYEKVASADAHMVGDISDRTLSWRFLDNVARVDQLQSGIRLRAAQNGVINRDTYEAEIALSNEMLALSLRDDATIPTTRREQLINRANRFYRLFEAETAGATDSNSEKKENRYTGYSWRYNTWSGQESLSDPRANLEAALRSGNAPAALAIYRKLMVGYNTWVTDRLSDSKEKVIDAGKDAASMEVLTTLASELDRIRPHNPKRILAHLYPDNDDDEQYDATRGYLSSIPLTLYYWKEVVQQEPESGTGLPTQKVTWYLMDLTNPSDRIRYDLEGRPDQEVPPPELIALLNDEKHARGTIRYRIPGYYAGSVETTKPTSFKQYLEYIGAGLALVGLTIATLVSGGATVGGWILLASQIIGGAAAVLDIAEGLEHDNLSATRTVIDLATIAATFLNGASLVAGEIRSAAAAADVAGTRWTGTMAKLGELVGRAYVPIKYTSAAVDMVTVAVISYDILDQIRELSKNLEGDPRAAEKMTLLITQLIINGTMLLIQVKDGLHMAQHGDEMSFHIDERGELHVFQDEQNAIVQAGGLLMKRLLVATERDTTRAKRIIALFLGDDIERMLGYIHHFTPADIDRLLSFAEADDLARLAIKVHGEDGMIALLENNGNGKEAFYRYMSPSVADPTGLDALVARAGLDGGPDLLRVHRAIAKLGPGVHAESDIQAMIDELKVIDGKILYGRQKEASLPNQEPSGEQREIIGAHSSEILNDPLYTVKFSETNPDGTISIKFTKKLQWTDSKGALRTRESKSKLSTLAPVAWSNDDILLAGDIIGRTPVSLTRVRDQATLHQGKYHGIQWVVIKEAGVTTSSYPSGGGPVTKF